MNAEYKLTLQNRSEADADSRSKELLKDAKNGMGFIPNMYSAMANSSILFDTYIHGYKLFREQSSFTPVEQEVIFLAISRENGCNYCMGAHSFIADNMSKVPVEVTDAIRNDDAISDGKLSALTLFVTTMVSKRGLPTNDDVSEFLAANYTEHHVLEIILAISVKTISNYANHMFHTELDEVFKSREW
ncbi:MAG: carboxymuconolactone decarboxylase family protein [Piscirickettsiaceae bacterium]|nr:carboxymuconolactone decarboxylase family protein [Piscirickettsiaceae bacterium]